MVFFGEDVAAAGGVFKATPGLHERFGDERVFDTPISELALAGAAYGAAVTGLRPVIEIMFGDFMALPMDSLVNQAAKYWYVSNEQGSVPLVVRSAVGAGGRFGAIHSQNHGTWFQGIPGLKIARRPRPAEAKGLLKAAIRDHNPVIFLEHKRLYSVKGDGRRSRRGDAARRRARRARGRRPDDRLDRQGRARRARGRGRARLPTASTPRSRPAHAAPARRRGVLRSMALARTGSWRSRRGRGRAAGRRACSARSPSAALHDLDDAWIVATDETPIPYSPSLEDAFLPSPGAIVASVRERLSSGSDPGLTAAARCERHACSVWRRLRRPKASRARSGPGADRGDRRRSPSSRASRSNTVPPSSSASARRGRERRRRPSRSRRATAGPHVARLARQPLRRALDEPRPAHPARQPARAERRREAGVAGGERAPREQRRRARASASPASPRRSTPAAASSRGAEHVQLALAPAQPTT